MFNGIRHRAPALTVSLRLSSLASAAALAACGGGSAPEAAAPAVPAANPAVPVVVQAPDVKTLSGSVAVGAPITSGKLRVLDASGAVVAAEVAVGADGRYPAVTLTGEGPWRIEACGYAGANYQCIYSVAQAAGTANVTPLTSAMILLASGQSPEALMNGAATGLTPASLATAQNTLRSGLASVLSEAGVSSSIDLVSATLDAGSRSGYDRVLDAIGVSLGADAQPFVQIVPRLGSGNLYLEQGSTPVGTLTTDSRASQVPLQGLDALFDGMTEAIRTAASCSNPDSGLVTHLASNATLTSDETLSGPAAVGAGLCAILAGGDGEPVRLGSRFLSPTLGRCDLSGPAPVCGVSFALQGSDGGVELLGDGMGVTYERGAWKFKGDLLSIGIHASAHVQRDRRVDGGRFIDSYGRALAFDIPALHGLACARVSQTGADGSPVTLAYYKPHAADNLHRLSAWRAANDGSSRSLDPAVGDTRNADDTWLHLPEGADGDSAVRNFFRGGRSVTVALYGDAQCSTPFSVDGRSSFEVEVQGVPPVWAQLPGLPWPSLSDASAEALRGFSVAASSTANFTARWGFTRGSVGVNGLTFCSDRATCGDGDSGRLGEAGLRGAATTGSVTVRTGSEALAAGSYKMLAVYGRTAEGVDLQSNHMSCPAVAAGLACEH